MAFKGKILDSSKPQEGDLVIYNLDRDGGLPALVGYGEVTFRHGQTFVVESKIGGQNYRRIMENGQARVVLSASERLGA